jgi:dipeptidyl aminopeptidase/acylaminoacyl peptidase
MKAWKVCIAVAAMLAAAPVAAVDLAQFLKQDGLEKIKISPTGEYYAMTMPLEDRTALVVIRRSDKQVTAKVGGEKHSLVDGFWWANNERIVVSMAEKFGSEDQPYATGELYAINADGSQPKLLVSPYGTDNPVNAIRIGGAEPRAASLIDDLPDDDRHVLIGMSTYSANPTTHVERLNIYTGKLWRVASAPIRRARFATDAQGMVRFARGAGNDNISKLYYRDGNEAEWRLMNDEAKTHRVEIPLGFSADGRTAYLQTEHAQGPDAIVAVNLDSGDRRELLRDATVDPYVILRQHNAAEPVGALFTSDRARSRFFDETSSTARMYRALEKAFPDNALSITSATRDGRLLLLSVWSDRNVGDFYLYDTAEKRADRIFSRREWLDPALMAPSRAVKLKARDGLALHGFLTVPRNAATEPPPLVVMPHGGPFGIFDEWSFDIETQMLAQSGYAVLRVNFRGSGNYGRAFHQAGARQWGGTMQHDLTDATRWAIEQKIADPQRICIYGASYGAYAAMMGAAMEPALYRCAAGYVGVYDLPAMHKDDAGVTRWLETWVNEWVGERSTLASRSPTTLAGNIKVPVFMAAGGKDERAPISHSKKMEKALKAAGTPVETLYFPTEGHGFYTEPHRREYYTRLLAFLARHLGGDTAN